jgi:predicted Zn-dependent peptidase
VVAVHVEQAPILLVELLWNAGRPYERKRMVADATNALLTEGTADHSAAELEALFEQYGTSLDTPDDPDVATLRLTTLVRHAPRLLPVMAEVAAAPAFTEAALTRYRKRSKQQLREDLQDPDTLAYRLLSEATFGADHPYGYGGEKADYGRLTMGDIREHHERCYGARNATLRVVGQLSPAVERQLADTFGQLPTGTALMPNALPELPETPRLIRHPRPRAQQTLIRRGRPGFRVTDPDYPGLCVLETILGGYYGSRLMRNIREEKGYTYGIDSDLDTYRFDGTLGIAADVANENLAAVRREIATEMDKLRQDLVPDRELDMVRAYLIGGLVQDLDGPLAVSARYRSAIVKNYDAADHLRRLDETIRHITAVEVRELARRYLRPEMDWEVVVGGGAPVQS